MSQKFFCEYCGKEFKSIRDLTSSGLQCCNNPNGAMNGHKLYEGTEKSEYICKYCGKKFRSFADLTSNGLRCPKNPNGTRHYPAL